MLAAALILGWGFCAGLAACLGETFESLAAISLITLTIYTAQPLTAHQALLSGLLAIAGGLLQTALALLFWPVQRYGPERHELSALYGELSQAAGTSATSHSPPVTRVISAAKNSLAPLSGDMNLQAERLWSLLNQAERIRITLLALRRLRKRLQRESNGRECLQIVNRYLLLTSSVLNAITQSIEKREPAASAIRFVSELEVLSEQVRKLGADQREPSLAALENDLRTQMDRLTGQLRAAARSTSESTAAAIQDFIARDAQRPWQSRFFGNVAKLRANMTLRAPAFRHALRLTFCLAVGEALAHRLNHPRSYWLAMTIVIVLRQEFAATFQRGTLRILGTILGLSLATLLFHVRPPGVGFEVLLVAVMVFLLRWVGAGNYGLFSMAMSGLVVLLLGVAGVAPAKLIWPRAEMTVLGGLVALATFVAWPTWERGQLPEMLAQLLEAYRHYFGSIARARIESTGRNETEISPLRMAARLARSNMEASFDKLRAEPAPGPEIISLVAAIMANSHRFVRAVMALEAVSPESAPTRPEFGVFAADVDRMLGAMILGLRREPFNLGDLPDLREDHHRLVCSANVSRYHLINEETDRITNSLNTLAEQIAHLMTLHSDFLRK